MFLTYQDLTIRNATAEDAPLLERWPTPATPTALGKKPPTSPKKSPKMTMPPTAALFWRRREPPSGR